MSSETLIACLDRSAFDFSRAGLGVKAAVAWPGLLAKIFLPQEISANYFDMDLSIPLTGELLAVSNKIEAIGLLALAASVFAPRAIDAANGINMASGMAVFGGSAYMVGRILSLATEGYNWLGREFKAARLEKEAEETAIVTDGVGAVFESCEQSTVELASGDIASFTPTSVYDFSQLTGQKFAPQENELPHIFEFKIKKKKTRDFAEALSNFQSIFVKLHEEAARLNEKPVPTQAEQAIIKLAALTEAIAKSQNIAAPETPSQPELPPTVHSLHMFVILSLFNRHKKVYEALGFKKVKDLGLGQSAWVLQ